MRPRFVLTPNETQESQQPVESESEEEAGPSVFDLARSSPSKPRRKTTARKERADRDKYCAKCDVKHDSYVDKKIASPWIGCDAQVNDDKSNFCAHAIV